MRVDGPKVLEFDEKPNLAEGVVSGGFFVFQREVFDYLDDDPDLFLEQQPLRNLARDGQLSVYLHEGFWHPMDTYRDYLYLNELWKRGETPWKIW
jgi:glucose-1-phosphate cytidylyltransferase